MHSPVAYLLMNELVMVQRSEHPSALRVPLLENGDRLTRVEFERRYEAHPEIKKAELLNGRVLIPSRTGTTAHGESTASLGLLLGTYAAESRMLLVTSNSTLRIDEDNEPQPDLILRIDADGCLQSRMFPGLRIDVPALLAGDDRKALATLRSSLEVGAHRSLLARLDAAD